MGNVVWSDTTDFDTNKATEVAGSGTGWIGFLEALGRMESSSDYGEVNGSGYTGIYQWGDGLLADLHLSNGLLSELFGISDKEDLVKNPIAQELLAIMEFSGIPDLDSSRKFASRYTAVRNSLNISTANFDSLVDITFTIIYQDANNTEVGRHENVTFSREGISAAAHLIGADRMADAMAEVYNACFNNTGTQTSSSVTLSTTGYADGNNIAFSSYVKLLDGKDISTLTSAADGANFTQFNQFAQVREFRGHHT